MKFASKNKVNVKIILDKTQVSSKYSASKYFIKNNTPIYVDKIRGIAHNKVLIIDGKTVVGGSFNYTKNAQKANAENVVIIRDVDFAEQYIKNWIKGKNRSILYK